VSTLDDLARGRIGLNGKAKRTKKPKREPPPHLQFKLLRDMIMASNATKKQKAEMVWILDPLQLFVASRL
jgi:hypothetical protein